MTERESAELFGMQKSRAVLIRMGYACREPPRRLAPLTPGGPQVEHVVLLAEPNLPLIGLEAVLVRDVVPFGAADHA